MAGHDPAGAEGRGGGKPDDGLADVVTRAGLHPPADLVLVGLGRPRTDEDAVPTRLVGRLHHHLVQVREHVAAVVIAVAEPGRDVGDKGFLVQVVADQGGHVGVDHLVVGHPGSRRIGDGHLPRLPRPHEPGDAESGVTPEHLGVEEQVVDPAVDHVDANEPTDGAQVHAVVVDDEVLALHEVGAHLLGQEGMLEVSGVEDPRCEHGDNGRLARAGRQAGQHAGQFVWVVVHRLDVEIPEQVGEHPLGDLAVLEHVRDAGRHAQVVLEHVHGAVHVAHEVGAADVGPNALGRPDALALGPVVDRRGQELGREHAVGHHPGRPVKVGDEEVEGRQALDEPPRDPLPLLGGYHTRDHVEGPGLVDIGGFGIHGEGDPHRPDSQFGCLLARHQPGPERHQVTHHPVAGMTGLTVEQ